MWPKKDSQTFNQSISPAPSIGTREKKRHHIERMQQPLFLVQLLLLGSFSSGFVVPFLPNNNGFHQLLVREMSSPQSSSSSSAEGTTDTQQQLKEEGGGGEEWLQESMEQTLIEQPQLQNAFQPTVGPSKVLIYDTTLRGKFETEYTHTCSSSSNNNRTVHSFIHNCHVCTTTTTRWYSG